MAKVKITQALCPARHCLGAIAFDAGTAEEAEKTLKQQLADLILQKQINPWCGLCGASMDSWHYETGETKFNTLKEAIPALRATQEKQQHTREWLIRVGAAYDSKKWN